MNNKEIQDKTLEDLLYHAVPIAGEEIVEQLNKNEKVTVTFSAEHELKMKKIFSKYKKQEMIKKFPIYNRRIASVLIIFFVLSAVSVLSVSAWRVKLLNFIMNITDTNTEIRFKEDDFPKGDSYTSEYISLNYIPEGFKLSESNGNNEKLNLVFEKDTYKFILRVRRVEMTLNIDTEQADMKKVPIKESTGLLTEKSGQLKLTWNNDEYSYTLSGNISEEMIIKIAENLN